MTENFAETERLLMPAEAAQRLNVHYATLWRWERQGKLSAARRTLRARNETG